MMTRIELTRSVGGLTRNLLFGLLLALPLAAHAQEEPTLTSVTPAHAAMGVSPTAPIVFGFSKPMNPEFTEAEFVNVANFEPITWLTESWSADRRTLTYTPAQPLPANSGIVWYVDGVDSGGLLLSADALELDGWFTTGDGTGNGSTGSNTNAVTSFVVGLVQVYRQESAGPPVLDPDYGYEFFASTTLASNRTATSVSLAWPTGETADLMRNPLQSWMFFYSGEDADDGSIEETYPPGNYVFTVRDTATSDLVVTVTLPNQPQPNPPHVSNYPAAQQINPEQSFTLTWEPFEGATAADIVQLEVYDFLEFDAIFRTPDPDEPGALPGTATSVVIPANTLVPSHAYQAWLTFTRWSASSNPVISTAAVRITETEFEITTINGGSLPGPVSLANASVAPDGTFSFNVISEPGQALVIEAADRLDATEWIPLLTTVNTDGILPFADAASATQSARFYRVRPN